ncbi:MAG: hypothetical protein M0Z28_18190 [Rhodospirillales bacterium]|nr:hypothetical protein [Rhodospirillales bacterium]
MAGLRLGPKIVPTEPVEIDDTHKLAFDRALYIPGGSAALADITAKLPSLALANGPLPASTAVGPALQFNGSTQYASVSAWPGALPMSAVTVSVGVQILAVGSGTNTNIFEFDNDGGDPPWGLQALLSGSNPWFAGVFGGTQYNIISATTVAAGGFYRLIFTYDGSRMRLFVNGAEDANSPVVTSGVMRGVGQYLTLATTGLDGIHGRFANIRMTDVGISSQAWTADQAAWLAAEPFAMLRPTRRVRVYVPSGNVIRLDAGNPAAWSADLSRGSSAAVEWVNALTHNAVDPLAWPASLATTETSPVAWLAAPRADSPALIAWAGAPFRLAAAPVNWLSGLRADRAQPVAYSTSVTLSATAPLEWLGRAVAVHADGASPVEWSLRPATISITFNVSGTSAPPAPNPSPPRSAVQVSFPGS